MRELGVRQSQQKGDVEINHIDGKRNIADLFRKEIKDSAHFQNMAFTITTPRLVANATNDEPEVFEGGVKSGVTWSEPLTSRWIPPAVSQAIGQLRKLVPTTLLGMRAL
jgi:hypothetical protein